MVKTLLLATVISSSCFLIVQFLTIHYFNGLDEPSQSVHKHSYGTNLLQNVKSLYEICKNLKISCVLVDKDVLAQFILLEKEHRSAGTHHHTRCNIFCRTLSATFLIRGVQIHNKVDYFVRLISDKGFHILQDEDYDQREVTLEQKHGKYKLNYHLFLEKDNAFIHIVFSYPRFNHEWMYTCNLQLITNRKQLSFLESSAYCFQQNIFRTIVVTHAIIDGLKIEIPQYVQAFLDESESSKFVSCNYDNARAFYSKYGFDTSTESEIFRTQAQYLLSVAVDVLNDLGVRFWLSSGTCLGWYRQCNFIPYSKDVDIGIWIKDYNKLIIDQLKERGLVLKHIFGKIKDSFELSFTLSGLKLDIFFFYEDENYMWNGGTQARTGKKFKYLFKKFTLCWTSISTLLVRVPCDTNDYIVANYGEKWNTVVKTWDWKASPPNVQENGEWPEEERSKVIKVF